jgi:hypothetical protein
VTYLSICGLERLGLVSDVVPRRSWKPVAAMNR